MTSDVISSLQRMHDRIADRTADRIADRIVEISQLSLTAQSTNPQYYFVNAQFRSDTCPQQV